MVDGDDEFDSFLTDSLTEFKPNLDFPTLKLIH